MQATTVRVASDVKDDLDRLQGYVLSQRGKRLSHSELLARLLLYAHKDPDLFIAHSGGDEPRKWTAADWKAWKSRLVPWEVKTDVSRLDEDLYQDPHSARQPVR